MKNLLYILFITLFGLVTIQAQNITLKIGDAEGMPGDTVFVPVTASSVPGNTSILSMQGTIKFDNDTKLSFTKLTSSSFIMNPGYYAELFDDTITFSISDGLPLLTITENTPLFEIEVFIKEEGCTVVSIIDGITPIQFANTDEEVLPVDASDTGTVSADNVKIFADSNDITNSLTYTLPCDQNMVVIAATNLTNESYFSPEFGASPTGTFMVPNNSTLDSFSVEITGMDACDNDYMETVTVIIASVKIFADGVDITNSLTDNLPCDQETFEIATTNLTNVSYFSPELGPSATGFYILPNTSGLEFFSVDITGEDLCGDVYTETVTVTIDPVEEVDIIANGDDITSTLTYTLNCNQNEVEVAVTHLTNVSYDSPELGPSTTGVYTVPNNSGLTMFTINIYGTDTCGDPYEEKIDVFVGENASFITNVELLNTNYSNPTGSSPGNYGDYTDPCIPYFDSTTGLIQVTTTAADLFMSVYVDSQFAFNTFTEIGVTEVNLQNANLVGGELIRIIVSQDQILGPNDIPTCGEVEDYTICIPTPEECAIEVLTSIGSCSDNGTPGDPTDDYYNITLEVFNTDDQPWTVVDSNGLTIYFGDGDENNVDLGDYLVLNGSEGFQIRYDDDCILDFGVVAPTSCNFSCNISAVVTEGECNDNGTPGDPSDDTYTIFVSVLGTNGVSWDLIGYAGSQPISSSGTGNTTNFELGPINANAGSWVMYISPTGLVDSSCKRYETTIFPPKCSDGEQRPKMSIAPNPSKGRMNIKVETVADIQNITLRIYDFSGLQVDTIENLKVENGMLDYNLDLTSKLKHGIYFFIFNIGNETITKQVIVE